MAAPLATLTGMNALENLMDSEAGIVEVVLGTGYGVSDYSTPRYAHRNECTTDIFRGQDR